MYFDLTSTERHTKSWNLNFVEVDLMRNTDGNISFLRWVYESMRSAVNESNGGIIDSISAVGLSKCYLMNCFDEDDRSTISFKWWCCYNFPHVLASKWLVSFYPRETERITNATTESPGNESSCFFSMTRQVVLLLEHTTRLAFPAWIHRYRSCCSTTTITSECFKRFGP